MIGMAKHYDAGMKKLVRANPQAFVDLVIPEATLLSEELYELESVQREVDTLLHVMIHGQEMLAHLEFQTYNDSRMDERLLQ
jgi:predicted transposase YdaD